MSNQELMTVDNAYMPALSVPQAVMRFNTLVEFVQTVMRDGVDFGTIPGTPKPTLFKAGAEKLTTLFGLTVRFNIVEQVEEWNSDEPFFYYWYRCSLLRGDRLIAEADGSCNSRESKYRWRWVSAQDVPAHLDIGKLIKRGGTISEFTFAVEKAETGGKYGKPLEHWQAFQQAVEAGTARLIKRKTNAGKEMDAWEIDSTLYRVPNEDIASQVNTVQKMAQKRAFVAVTLIGVNASEFFTQDIEDIELVGAGTSYTPPTTIAPVIIEAKPIDPIKATDKQRRYLGALMDDLGWSSEYMAAFAHEHKIDLVELSAADAGYFIEQMKAVLNEPAKVAQDLKAKAVVPTDAPVPGGIEELVINVQTLRECERNVISEPPQFTWNSKKGRAALANERTASISRIYAWLLTKMDADTVHQLPPLEELDDQGLIDLAYATAGL